ncbi:DMT family transporter [Arthrobacter zhaoguopingii]|uniref:DMT family transporter n=1 Tax=Arthrobacter zhaoguopingii TaxID=2681491 RepID=UPI0019159CC1|nr:DMT family transporter [Arthrobacter zhaoguopingii]
MTPMSNVALALRFVLLAAVWGLSFLFIKIALEGLSPQQVVLGRMVLGATTLAIVVGAGRYRLPRGFAVWAHLFFISLFLCVIPFTLFAVAETEIDSGLASIYNATTPLITGLIAFAALPEERLTPRAAVGILTGFLGVAVVVGVWSLGASASNLRGQMLCLGATLCYGIAMVWIRKFISPLRLPAASVAFVQVGLGAVTTLALAPVFSTGPARLNLPIAVAMLGLGCLSTGMAYLWNTQIIAGWGATIGSSVTYLTPVVGVVAGATILGESLTWHQPLGALIIVAGVVLARSKPRARSVGQRVSSLPPRE